MKSYITLLFGLVCLFTFIPPAFPQTKTTVGFQQFTLNDDSNRPLNITLWYPASQTESMERVGENIVFIGTDVVRNVLPAKGRYPVVLLSHGYRGNWRNLNWLGTKLAQQGMVVAATNHPGTTTFDHSPLQAAQWWQRPRDLVRILDHLANTPDWQKVIDSENVIAIGHSLGGWTVMLLAGAIIDRSTFQAHCQLYPNPKTCGLAKELGLDTPQAKEPKQLNFFDSRIKKVVSLDLGLARSFSIESLSRIKTPALILAAGIDIGDIPQALESGYLAEHLPLLNRHYQIYEQAMHFSFMQLCKPNAIALLEEEIKGDGIICKDGKELPQALPVNEAVEKETADKESIRLKLHQRMFNDIWQFITMG